MKRKVKITKAVLRKSASASQGLPLPDTPTTCSSISCVNVVLMQLLIKKNVVRMPLNCQNYVYILNLCFFCNNEVILLDNDLQYHSVIFATIQIIYSSL